ncbi:hypothetical protein CDV36_005226 [Fusarium kuroshium]|uniref:NACHT domain-containing protein n=1 Tax=Fusarium kuroshium TaxID=2010991 RepID=A0A3M2SC31_9HYPO|nr:hypothetical protein CDV36_005226 [Fusarium kuroshium]
MDPVTAFSLAGTILQFLDSGTRFAFVAHRLYRSGADAVVEYGDVRDINDSLTVILPELQGISSDSDSERSLGQLACDCGKVANELRDILNKVGGAGTGRKRDALKAAFRLIYKEDDIKALQDRLSSFRSQLNLHLLFSIREHVSKSAKDQEECLQKLGVVEDLTEHIGGISASILHYLVYRVNRPEKYSDDIELLQRDLTKVIYKVEGDKNEGCRPPNIQLTQSASQQAKSLFLASLQYDEMIDRESRISTAHESTFLWVFRDSNVRNDHRPAMRWSSLREWLETENQLYWITGKAGSGKSTLMKFLCSSTAREVPGDKPQDSTSRDLCKEQQSRCRPYLEKWAGTSKLLVASFYFWNSGTNLQMTQAGLLRTLLHQIVAQRPEILPNLAPKQWESCYLFGQRPEHWSTQDLRGMLFQAVKLLTHDTKICFFVDGLDEFDGSHDELISLTKSLIGDSRNVKVCVASRPWNVFWDAFGQAPNLRLEDLTFDDIKNFVKSRFDSDTVFLNIGRRYPVFADQLMDNIVVKASGVFLWVDLVVTSLLAGMRVGDRIKDLQRRLDDLPNELTNLYEKILHSLDPFYLDHAAQYFTLVESAETPLTILQFSFADEESAKSAVEMKIGRLSDGEIDLRIEDMNRRLNSRCKGFLEVERGLQGLQANLMRRPSQLTVQYLHRTVRDFIKSAKAQEFLQSSTNSNFDPSMQLCIAHLMDMKNWSGRQDDLHILDRQDEESPSNLTVIECLRQASRVAKTNEGAMIQVLDELKSVISRLDYKEHLANEDKIRYQAIDSTTANPREFSSSGSISLQLWNHGRKRYKNLMTPTLDGSFLSLACVHGVVPYVRARAERGGLIRRSQHDGQSWPLLLDALSHDVPQSRMVECLLDAGADPNFKVSYVDSQTPWKVALTRVSLFYTLNELDGDEKHVIAVEEWEKTLELLRMRGGGGKMVDTPEHRRTGLSGRILREVEEETGATRPKEQTTLLERWFNM